MPTRMPTHRRYSLRSLLTLASLARLTVISAILLLVVVAFVWAGGFFSTRHLDQARIVDAFEATGLNAESIDWFVPHQANKRIIDASAHKLHIAPQKVVLTVDLHGNTSAASIPLALSVAVADGRIKRGDLVLLEAMGGGFTWGSALLRW